MGSKIQIHSIVTQWILTQANMNYQMFSNSQPIIEIHNTGQAIQNNIYLIGLYARTKLKCFAQHHPNNDSNTRGRYWPYTF